LETKYNQQMVKLLLWILKREAILEHLLWSKSKAKHIQNGIKTNKVWFY